MRPGDRVRLDPDVVVVPAARAAGWLDAPDGLDADLARRVCCPHDASPAATRALFERAASAGFAVAPDPGRPGARAHVALERGLVGCPAVAAGAEPGVGALGGVGALAFTLDGETLDALARAGTAIVQVPRAREIVVGGFLPRRSGPHDLALALRKPLLEAGARDGALPVVHELAGPAIEALCVPGRVALCEALGRLGLWAVVPPDEKTRTWLAARCRDVRHLREDGVVLDRAAREDALTLRAEAARPRAIVLGDDPTNGPVHNVEGHEATEVHEIVLGATLEQLRVAVEALRDRRVARGVALRIVPVTPRTLLHAVEEGGLAELLRAGAVVAPPGDVPAPGAPGRLVTRHGHPGDVLVSAAVAASSSVTGRLVDLETMRHAVRRTRRRL